MAILVLVTVHETKSAWYSSLSSSPIGALLICSRCFSEMPFCVVFRLSRVAQTLSAWSWVFMCSHVCLFCCSYIDFQRSGPTPALQSWREHFRVQRLLKNPPSGVLIVSARKNVVGLPDLFLGPSFPCIMCMMGTYTPFFAFAPRG